VLPEKFASPLYVAVIEWDPMEKAFTVNCAVPLDGSAELPREAAPSSNVTVPVGAPVEVD
jgi:hypothetical protein